MGGPDGRKCRWIGYDWTRPQALKTDEMMQSQQKRRGMERVRGCFFPLDVLELISVCTPCVGIGDTVRIIPTEPKTHQKSQFNVFIWRSKDAQSQASNKVF